MLRVQNSGLAILVDLDGPLAFGVLFGLDNIGLGPDRQLHSRSVPLHEKTEFLSRSISRPVLGEGEVREVVGPVREVKREVFISLSPDLTNLSVPLNDEVRDTQSLESSGEGKTTLRHKVSYGTATLANKEPTFGHHR